MTLEGIVGEIKDEYKKLQFDWKIKNFFSLEQTVDNRYHSSAFDCYGKSFFLQVYPNGEKRNKSEGWISMYLVSRERCYLFEAKLQFAIRTTDGALKNNMSIIGTFGRKGKRWGVSHFIDRTMLLDQRDKWAPLGDLTIAVTVEIGLLPEEISSIKVLLDISKMWQSGDNSDVVVRVRGAEFQAHKVILGARSPVLFAMFQHDTSENRSGEIKIEDCEPAIFQQFLHYLYTGVPQELSPLNASPLYAVAEKYMADDLKGHCLRYIRSNLCIDTFCETVILALKYGETELLQHATDFASENIREIVRSVVWQRFNENEPRIANEVLVKALR